MKVKEKIKSKEVSILKEEKEENHQKREAVKGN